MIAMSKLHRIKNYKLSPIEVNKDSKKLGQRKNKIGFFTEAKYRSCFFRKKSRDLSVDVVFSCISANIH